MVSCRSRWAHCIRFRPTRHSYCVTWRTSQWKMASVSMIFSHWTLRLEMVLSCIFHHFPLPREKLPEVFFQATDGFPSFSIIFHCSFFFWSFFRQLLVFQPSWGKGSLDLGQPEPGWGVTGLSAHSSRSLGCNVSALDGPMIYPLVN